MRKNLTWGAVLALGLFVAGCTDDDHDDHGDEDGHDHEETEVISTVELTFTPEGGGETVTAAFRDPDGDGGVSGSSEPIELTLGTTYTLSISLLNELEDPPEDITVEIEEEAEEHMIFVYGEGVGGPASSAAAALVTHAYADVESDYGDNAEGDDLPVGLRNTISADAEGMSELSVMMRHLPPLNGEAQKSGELPELLANGDALPGEVDVDVSFELNVVP